MKARFAASALGLCLTLLAAMLPAADTPHAFVAGSYRQILAAHPERPLLIAFWSLGCAHCLEELPRLAAWAKRQSHATVVMVSTDSPDDVAEISATLRKHGLGQKESWVFTDELPERLRYEIDPRWRGELPRTVLRGRDGALRTVTGRLEPDTLDRWLRNTSSR